MNTASLNLCKELYKLSGWGDDDRDDLDWYRRHKDLETIVIDIEMHDSLAPAYTLGYLLRKLELKDGWNHGRLDLSHCADVHESGTQYYWAVSFNSYDNDFPVGEANTPEDAVCKLAIELFKQGILSKDNKEIK